MIKKIQTITLVTILIVIGIGVFYACKKEESGESLSDAVISKCPYGKDLVILDVSELGWHGVGHGQDKICEDGGRRCWLWFQVKDHVWRGDNNTIAVVNFVDYNTNIIELDFTYTYNDRNLMERQNMFNKMKNVFIIDEDIIEGPGSYLLKIMGTSSSCIIPAGSYPITTSSEGIKVKLPVIIDKK